MRSVAAGSETVPTVFVGSHTMVNPSLGQVLTAVRKHAPNLEAGGEPTRGRWQPIAAVLTVAVLWLVLAARSPTTTYHLAPMLMAAAAPVARRLPTGTPVSSRTALTLATGSLSLTLATIVMIGWLWGWAGPDLTGGAAPVAESVLLAVLGAAAGWWWARRGNHDV